MSYQHIVCVDYGAPDRNQPPDFGAFRRACEQAGSTIGVAMLRGSYGASPDPTIGRDREAAEQAGFVVGGYAFLRMRPKPGEPGYATPEDQIRVFADNHGPLLPRHMIPAIDVEDTGMTSGDELEWVHRAWMEMQSIFGVDPILYDSARVWHEDLHDLPPGEMVRSWQWVSKPWPWPPLSPPVLSAGPFASGRYQPTVPPPWHGRWLMHQYQGDALPVPGFSHTVDLSRFNILRQGDHGTSVEWVQQQLGMPVDGVFGPDTASRLRCFQIGHGLVADAIFGPRSFVALARVNITSTAHG